MCEFRLFPVKADLTLYLAFTNGDFADINRCSFNELLRAGLKMCLADRAKTHGLFETSGDETFPFKFAEFNVAKKNRMILDF